jgi:hypothetical protein
MFYDDEFLYPVLVLLFLNIFRVSVETEYIQRNNKDTYVLSVFLFDQCIHFIYALLIYRLLMF